MKTEGVVAEPQAIPDGQAKPDLREQVAVNTEEEVWLLSQQSTSRAGV